MLMRKIIDPSFFKNKWVFRILFAFVAVLLFSLAISWRFIQDDAFISFCYSRNFAQGKGLVFYPGVVVEGYTNFLWTIIMSVPYLFQWNPETFAHTVCLGIFALTIWQVYRLSFFIMKNRYAALFVLCLCAINFSFISYVTGGLETQLQTFLDVFSLNYFLRMLQSIRRDPLTCGQTCIFSLIQALMLCNRLDAAVFTIVYTSVLLFSFYRYAKADFLKHLLCLSIPGGSLLLFWFIGRYSYYGYWLPNTFYVKMAGVSVWRMGMRYVFTFFTVYGMLPFCILGIFLWRKIIKSREMLIIISMTFLWVLYICKIGGDFMEFRQLVPIIPLINLLIVYTLFHYRIKFVPIVFLMITLFSSIYYWSAKKDKITQQCKTLSIYQLEYFYDLSVQVGQTMYTMFHGDPSVSIGVMPAGALPYYSKLRSYDMYGLNDVWTAHNGKTFRVFPGHMKFTHIEYLLENQVNLIFPDRVNQFSDFTDSISKGVLSEMIPGFDLEDFSKLPSDSYIALLPILPLVEEKQQCVAVLVLFPSPDIETVFKAYSVKKLSIAG